MVELVIIAAGAAAVLNTEQTLAYKAFATSATQSLGSRLQSRREELGLAIPQSRKRTSARGQEPAPRNSKLPYVLPPEPAVAAPAGRWRSLPAPPRPKDRGARPAEIDLAAAHRLDRPLHAERADVDVRQDGGDEQDRDQRVHASGSICMPLISSRGRTGTAAGWPVTDIGGPQARRPRRRASGRR